MNIIADGGEEGKLLGWTVLELNCSENRFEILSFYENWN